MLLDRRKVKFWQKIVFGFMAFLMAAFLVVGYSGVLNGCTWFNSAQEDVTKTLDQQIAKYQTATTTDPKDAAAWISLAEAYLSRSAIQQQGSQALTSDLTNAAAAYVKADKLLAKQKGAAVKKQRLDVLASLAGVYSQLGDSQAAAGVYGDITELTPKDADAFFNLGAGGEHRRRHHDRDARVHEVPRARSASRPTRRRSRTGSPRTRRRRLRHPLHRRPSKDTVHERHVQRLQ